MATLKIFCGNYDGRNNRAVVCATKKEAMAILGITATDMAQHYSARTEQTEDTRVVWESPGTVFVRPILVTRPAPAWQTLEQFNRQRHAAQKAVAAA